MHTPLCLNETDWIWVGVEFAHLECMVHAKHILIQMLTLLSFNLAIAQEMNNEVSCYEKVEGEYSYQTEVLLHVYEHAKVSPKEFEKLRAQLVSRRESALNTCEQNYLAEMDKFVENIQFNTVVHERTAGRGIASVGSRQPASLEPSVNSRHGAYSDVDPSDENQDDFIPEYDGERFSIEN